MKTIAKVLALTVLFFSTTSCLIDNFTGVKGNGNIISENRKINSDFDAIKVSQGIELILSQSDDFSLIVEADENIMDLLKTEVKGNTLHISFEKNVYYASARKVYLNTRSLSSLATSSGANIISENIIKSESLDLDASSGSSINVKIRTHYVQCETSSGATMNVSGTTLSSKFRASSGSSIHATELASKNTTAKVSSGANMDIYASESLTAKASSGGNIDYAGNPKTIDKDTSSGGSVSVF
ncbi:MAG: DUF2807 domain-containing protein [Flavobacteriaceae bacterium]|nr:DUF2807 domain-containing protein [Flavobacteriaceae bacterium]